MNRTGATLTKLILQTLIIIAINSLAVGNGLSVHTDRLPDESKYARSGVLMTGRSLDPGTTLDRLTRHELAFVDPGVVDYAALVKLLACIHEAGRKLELIVLDSAQNGVIQITDALSDRRNLDAIHVLSHGNKVALQLGNTRLDAETFGHHSRTVEKWRKSFRGGADILLYGCDLASSLHGRDLVRKIGTVSGTDVAASNNITGHSSLGGDWILEYQTGDIETSVVAHKGLQLAWFGCMAIEVDSSSTGFSSGTDITISHTTTGSNRLMLVGVSINLALGSEAVSTITYNGDTLTAIGKSGSGEARIEVWSLVAPDIGTADVEVVFTAVCDGATAGVMTFTGVDQATPLGTYEFSDGNSGSGSLTISSSSDEFAYGVIAVDDNTDYDLIEGAGQTEVWDLHGDEISSGGCTMAGAASVNMSWSWSGTDVWAMGGVSIKPSGVVADQTTTNCGDAASFTHSHTVSGVNRLMVVGISLNDGNTGQTVTYAGQSLTRDTVITHSGGKPTVELWHLVAPPPGTDDVVVNLSGGSSDKAAIGVISYTGVNQTTPIDGLAIDQGTSPSPSVTVASESGDLVQDVMASQSSGLPTVGSGQLQLWNEEMGCVGVSDCYGAGSTQAGASSVTMNWSLTESGKDWVIAALNINRAGELGVAVSNSTFAFGTAPQDVWLTPQTAVITNDGGITEDFVGRISQFTSGSNNWSISATTNGADSIRAQWSTVSSAGPWTDISSYASDFSVASNVAVSDSVILWFRIQTPTVTSSYDEHSSTLTVTAQDN